MGGWALISTTTVTRILFWLRLKEYAHSSSSVAPNPLFPLLTTASSVYLPFSLPFLSSDHCVATLSIIPAPSSSACFISSILHLALVSDVKQPLTLNIFALLNVQESLGRPDKWNVPQHVSRQAEIQRCK